ncbi:MAG: hypothetical protein QT05_C0006G0023 [archaeon GW2011_AR13]|nr:MAG: hypothetical protein QT05_C0006G0023 [archaeon GW2011_AR13]HIG95223.1 hypothetical protein [Nanoarchaeota archaeon]HIH63104.1 hypothetical protein [Nanoarchaeota archaeon]HIJ09159.1 hypothetical protein [Nanoarchaeota archaeon]
MTLKNIRLARAENLSQAIRDEHKLQKEGLIIIESHNPDPKEKFISITKEGGIRGYLLSKGKFLETSTTPSQ